MPPVAGAYPVMRTFAVFSSLNKLLKNTLMWRHSNERQFLYKRPVYGILVKNTHYDFTLTVRVAVARL